MTERIEFSMKVKKQAWDRANGFCECGCGRPFGKHPKTVPNYDHVIPAKLGGDATLGNCMCIRFDCHQTKTKEVDMPKIKKVRRSDKQRMGLKPKKRSTINGSKDSGWKRKIDGTVVRR